MLQLVFAPFPNPSKSVFNIESVDIRKVEVVDTHGQTVLSEVTGNYYLQINLSNKAAGAYMLSVTTIYGITRKKLVPRK